jgi:hypothetical protein
MRQSLLDRLVELIKLDYPDDWERLCHHAQTNWEPSLEDIIGVAVWPGPERAARQWLKSYRQRRFLHPQPSLETKRLCGKYIQLFSDVFRHQMVGRIKGTLEIKPIDPSLITAETLRFDPDELILDEGALIIVDVRVEPAFGDAVDGWVGKIIIIFPTMVDMRGKLTPALRVRIPPPKQAAVTATAAPKAATPSDNGAVAAAAKPPPTRQTAAKAPADPELDDEPPKSLADELDDEIEF